MTLLKIGVFGSQPRTITQLESLQDAEGIEIRCIVAPQGIGQQNPVRQWTLQNECRHLLRLPVNPREFHFLETIGHLQLDFIVTAGFPQRIPASVLALAKYGGVNVHPSALPRYRGPDPIRRAILAGDDTIGCTIHKLTQELEAGGVYWQKQLPLLEFETTGDLAAKTGQELAAALPDVLRSIAAGKLRAAPQVGEPVYAPRVTPEELSITAANSSKDVQRRIRACAPHAFPRWQQGSASYQILSPAETNPSDAETVEINLQDGVHRFICQPSEARSLRSA